MCTLWHTKCHVYEHDERVYAVEGVHANVEHVSSERFERSQEDLIYGDQSDMSTCKLWLSQETYILKISKRFNMAEIKPITTPLTCHLRLSPSQCPNSQ